MFATKLEYLQLQFLITLVHLNQLSFNENTMR